jgi:hypothetical protein
MKNAGKDKLLKVAAGLALFVADAFAVTYGLKPPAGNR